MCRATARVLIWPVARTFADIVRAVEVNKRAHRRAVGGVHLFRRRREDRVRARTLERRQIGVEIARVRVNVVAGCELLRVDEDARRHVVILLERARYEGEVARVERAHRWDETEREARRDRAVSLQRTPLSDGGDDAHRSRRRHERRRGRHRRRRRQLRRAVPVHLERLRHVARRILGFIRREPTVELIELGASHLECVLRRREGARAHVRAVIPERLGDGPFDAAERGESLGESRHLAVVESEQVVEHLDLPARRGSRADPDRRHVERLGDPLGDRSRHHLEDDCEGAGGLQGEGVVEEVLRRVGSAALDAVAAVRSVRLGAQPDVAHDGDAGVGERAHLPRTSKIPMCVWRRSGGVASGGASGQQDAPVRTRACRPQASPRPPSPPSGASRRWRRRQPA